MVIFKVNKEQGILKRYVVVVYHVTIVAIGHGLLKKFWPLVIGCVLRTAVIERESSPNIYF